MAVEEEIKNIEGYLAVIKSYKEKNIKAGNSEDFLFRGQQGDHPLIPKIARLKPKTDIETIEALLLNEFKRTNPLLIESHRPYDDWDYLTLGQHFGLPTRLLDWSNNALTALWFATEGAEKSPQSYRVIWILMPESRDFDLDIEKTPPFSIGETKIFRPRIIKQRINNQSGVFSVHTLKEIKEKCELSSSGLFKNKLVKIKIPASAIAEIREDLNLLGVNAFSIFPELEGLCAYLQWRYFS